MQNITITVTTEQEKKVLLAFLNALKYKYTLIDEDFDEEGAGNDSDDNRAETLQHYATE